jgi:Flp pilus assembly protein TadD
MTFAALLLLRLAAASPDVALADAADPIAPRVAVEPATYLEGQAALAGGRPSEAIPLFRASIAEEQGSVRSQLALGHALAFAGDWAASEAALRALVDVAHDDARALCALGTVRGRQGSLDGARVAFERAVTVASGDACGPMGLGRVAMASGDWRGAVPWLERAVELGGGAEAQRALRDTHQHLGHRDAVRALDAVLATR